MITAADYGHLRQLLDELVVAALKDHGITEPAFTEKGQKSINNRIKSIKTLVHEYGLDVIGEDHNLPDEMFFAQTVTAKTINLEHNRQRNRAKAALRILFGDE